MLLSLLFWLLQASIIYFNSFIYFSITNLLYHLNCIYKLLKIIWSIVDTKLTNLRLLNTMLLSPSQVIVVWVLTNFCLFYYPLCPFSLRLLWFVCYIYAYTELFALFTFFVSYGLFAIYTSSALFIFFIAYSVCIFCSLFRKYFL